MRFIIQKVNFKTSDPMSEWSLWKSDFVDICVLCSIKVTLCRLFEVP